MKRLFQIILLSIFPIVSYCQYAVSSNSYRNVHVSQRGVDTTPNKPMTCDVFGGYSFGFANKIPTHGINMGVLYSYNYFMLGCDFKVSLTEPEIDNHSWGGYAIFGFKYKYFGLGAMIGGCSIYNDYYISNYYNYYGYYIYNPYATYQHYKSISKFDGGFMFVGDIPISSKNYGMCIVLSSTYYTPISLSIGFMMNNY